MLNTNVLYSVKHVYFTDHVEGKVHILMANQTDIALWLLQIIYTTNIEWVSDCKFLC